MKVSATGFRLRLFVMMTLIVTAVTVVAIIAVQGSMQTDLARNLDRRFESEFDALLSVQHAHTAAVMDQCRALVRSPRIHAAIEDGGLDLLYAIAEGELRTVLPSPRSPTRTLGRGSVPPSLLRVECYRFLDPSGAVIPPPPDKADEASRAWESQISVDGLPDREEFGYIIAKIGDEPEAIHQIVATPIVSSQTGEVISAMVLVFRPIEMPARLCRGDVITGYWVGDRLELHPKPAGDTERVAAALRASGDTGDGEHVRIGGSPYNLHFRTLNLGSEFQKGVLVSLYPLADAIAQQEFTRWQIIGAGGLLLLGGLLVSHLISGRLSEPVEQLEITSTENAEQRVRAEAALEITNRELSLRNTELQKALGDLKATQQQVIQQERLRALGQMASGIAHDFNNALVPILGFAELLKMSPSVLADREKAVNYIDMIHTSATDASSVVSRLRQFYRKQEEGDVFEAVNIEKLAKQTATLTRPRWKDQAQANGATIQLKLELEPVPAISGDEAALREVLTNLIFNAVDAMPDGGTITLRTRRQGNCAVLEVADTGSGMTEEVRKRCLEPFFSTKGERGTGLGLSMVFGIVQRHGGSLDIKSELGRGTTFIISMPLREEAETKHEEAEAVKAAEPLRVLVVDDEPQVRDLLSAALTNDGHRVQIAEDGVAGLRCFRDGKFDVVLTDKAMPGLSGDQMACAIKQLAPEMPIILLTGFGQFLDKEDLPGVNVLLSKPIGLRTLREALSSVTKKAA